MKWTSYPFLKITSAFIIGILINESFECNKLSCYFLILIIVIFFLFHTYSLLRYKLYSGNILFGATGFLSFVLLGYISAQASFQNNRPILSADTFCEATFYTAVINSKPASTPKMTKFQVNIEHVKINNRWIPINTGAILYFKNNAGNGFKYGDRLLIKGYPKFLENQKNPHAFDYALYLQRRGIYLNDFISGSDYVLTNENHNASPKYLNLYIGDYFEEILSKNISSDRELNMIKAMLLGRREEITPEMKYVYASSGTAHILAVSGLHIGIIYFIISTLVSFLKKGKLRLIYFGVTLFGIWSFAFITGLSPSVQRASIMISFIIIADLFRRKSSIYNTILASAFFILLYAPNLIFSVSFQLSYAAVFGIIFLYNKIYNLIFVNNRFLRFLWQITVLSLSAQIATFPITIYYFNQFPLMFPLTNLVAIPTAMAAIGGGLLILVSSPLETVSGLLGKLLEGWVFIYNEILIAISSFPIAAVDNLYLKPSYVFMIIFSIIFLSSFLFTKKLNFFRYFSSALVILCISVMADYYLRSQQREIVFYHSNSNIYFDIFLNRNCYSNLISSENQLKSQVNYNISPNRKYHLIENIFDLEKLELVKKIGENILIQWYGKSILVLNKMPNIPENYAGISIDYLVIGKNLVLNISALGKLIKIKNLILDASIDVNTSELIFKKNSGINIYSISLQGAYKIVI